jgi:uncharacterized membrane protein YfbV (UPF0208 family)
MKTNIGTADRILRFLAVTVIVILFFTGNISGLAAIIFGFFAVSFTMSGLTGICPLYYPLKITTLRKRI